MTAKIIKFPNSDNFEGDINEEFSSVLNELKEKKAKSYFIVAFFDDEGKECIGYHNWKTTADRWKLLGAVESVKVHFIDNTFEVKDGEE